MNILFLYTELAEYTIACLQALKSEPGVDKILVIHYPINPEAPFKFNFNNIGQFVSISSLKKEEELFNLVDNFQPDKIIVSGWINKWYNQVCRNYRNKAVTVLTMDNHYKNTFKQKVFSKLFPLFIKRNYKYCWVPGPPQELYALKLGFKKKNIYQGFYCCNEEKFDLIYNHVKEEKMANFPKIFLCVARYVPQKNYNRLWNAFIEWQNRNPNEWELWCAGTGEGFENRTNHPKIRHLGFVQPQEWDQIIKKTGVFVLASIDEPWGVAVQEFACAGYPLFISNKIGAGTVFFNDNGYNFNPVSDVEIVKGFDYFNSLDNKELNNLSLISHQNSKRITLKKWAETVIGNFT
jgi:glycosyltransferase involved in cell wall biosynthesis